MYVLLDHSIFSVMNDYYVQKPCLDFSQKTLNCQLELLERDFNIKLHYFQVRIRNFNILKSLIEFSF